MILTILCALGMVSAVLVFLYFLYLAAWASGLLDDIKDSFKND